MARNIILKHIKTKKKKKIFKWKYKLCVFNNQHAQRDSVSDEIFVNFVDRFLWQYFTFNKIFTFIVQIERKEKNMLDSDAPWVSVTTYAFFSNREMAPLCGHVLVLYFLIQQTWTEVGQQNCSMPIILFYFILNQERIQQLSTF